MVFKISLTILDTENVQAWFSRYQVEKDNQRLPLISIEQKQIDLEGHQKRPSSFFSFLKNISIAVSSQKVSVFSKEFRKLSQ